MQSSLLLFVQSGVHVEIVSAAVGKTTVVSQFVMNATTVVISVFMWSSMYNVVSSRMFLPLMRGSRFFDNTTFSHQPSNKNALQSLILLLSVLKVHHVVSDNLDGLTLSTIVN